VPGDLIVIPPTGCLIPCDAVLLSGTCIVNESVLTGNQTTLRFCECWYIFFNQFRWKCSWNQNTRTWHRRNVLYRYPQEVCNQQWFISKFYSILDARFRHTIFCGTEVLQTRYYGLDKVLAVVIRTGFNTAKGDLVRSILYPKPIGFQFYIDSLKFVLLLFGVAVCGIIYCIYVYYTKGVNNHFSNSRATICFNFSWNSRQQYGKSLFVLVICLPLLYHPPCQVGICSYIAYIFYFTELDPCEISFFFSCNDGGYSLCSKPSAC